MSDFQKGDRVYFTPAYKEQDELWKGWRHGRIADTHETDPWNVALGMVLVEPEGNDSKARTIPIRLLNKVD